MTTKKISTRQLLIYYFIWSFSIKFLMLPSLLAKTAMKDAWVAAALGIAIELVVLFMALTVITRNQDTDIYSRLRGENPRPAGTPRTTWLRTPLAKGVIAVMLFVFALQLFILINQAFHLLNDNLFEKVPVHLFCIPMLILGVFFCFMPVRAIFRSGEIFFVFIILGIALSVFPAVTRINPSEVLPIFEQGGAPFARATYLNLIYFESAFFLLMFCGDIKVTKHFRTKFMSTAVILGLFFVFFIFMFYSLFGPLAPTKNLAVTNLTVYSSYLTGSGRLDWVLVTMWLLLLLMRFGLTFYCAFACLRYITGLKHRAGYLGFALAAAVYVISTFVFGTSRDLGKLFSSIPWLVAALYAAVPVLLLLVSLFKRRKRHV